MTKAKATSDFFSIPVIEKLIVIQSTQCMNEYYDLLNNKYKRIYCAASFENKDDINFAESDSGLTCFCV